MWNEDCLAAVEYDYQKMSTVSNSEFLLILSSFITVVIIVIIIPVWQHNVNTQIVSTFTECIFDVACYWPSNLCNGGVLAVFWAL